MRLTVLALTASLALIPEITQAQQQFDGDWSVVATPEKGACRARRYPVVIENGVIRSKSNKTQGRVQAGGHIQGSVQVRNSRVDVSGDLAARSGSGTWTINGRMNCSGRWTAVRG